MTFRKQARPVGAGLLLLLVVFALHCGEPDDRAAPPRPTPNLEGLEPVLEPAVSADALIRRSHQFLTALGFDPSGFQFSLRRNLDTNALEALRTEHATEPILAFARHGAPLVRWHATYLGPEVSNAQRQRITVRLDAHGRIRGFNGVLSSPLPYPDAPLQDWIAETRERIAGWMEIDPESLESMGGADGRNSPARRVHAMWSIRDVSLDESHVIVLVDQGPDSYNLYESISPLPGAKTEGPLTPVSAE